MPRPDPLALCTFGDQKVTTNGMYRLPHTVASPCQTRDVSSIAYAQRSSPNPRRACAARVTVVVSHLTSPMFVRLTNDTTYLTANDGQNFVRFSLKMLRCKARARKSQYANTQRLTMVRSIRVLCVPRRYIPEDATQGVYRLSHAI